MMKKASKIKAVFLDRDGVLIKRHDLTWKKSQLGLQSGVASFIKFLNKKQIPVIVVTNQPVVARGLITEDGVQELHKVLQKNLKKQGAFIDKFYFCPHHPEATLLAYRKKCKCRKPAIGMFQKAAKEFQIDLKKSFMIGDMTQDILAGNKAGTKTILLKKGHKGKDGKYKATPDFEFKNFKDILRELLRNI